MISICVLSLLSIHHSILASLRTFSMYSPCTKQNIISMHLEDKLALVKNCLDEGSSILFKSITSNRNPSDSSLLKTCFYHIKSLNESIQQENTHIVVRKENQPCELPRLQQNSLKNGGKISSMTSLLPKNPILLGKMLYQSSEKGPSSLSSFLKIPSNLQQRDTRTSSGMHQSRSPAKTKKRRNFKNLFQKPLGLSKEQRYFQNNAVSLSPQRVQALGLYQASNIYKAKNVERQINDLKLIASKPQFNPIKIVNKQDLFLTNIQGEVMDFCVEEFIEKELNKEKNCEKIINECNSVRMSKSIHPDEINQAFMTRHNDDEIEESDIYITIKDYSFVKDESFRIFKAKYINIWGDVLLSLERIAQCMKHQKISTLKVKSDKLTLWSGKKLSIFETSKLLGLQNIEKPIEKIEKICFGYLERLKVRKIKEKIARKESLARWVWTRMKTFTYLRKLKRQKKEKALKLHRQLVKEMDWETEIHLPSFSMDQFKRNTTQYLQSFENLYHNMWKNSTKHLILVLPTLNENIVKILQSRIRVKRNLTIICPEVHETFPSNLSLAAQVLFSYETLSKIQKAIDNKKTIIIPGCYESLANLENEMLLSEYLNVPLLCSLEMTNSFAQQKQFFKRANLDNHAYCVIQPSTISNEILVQFGDLLMNFPQQKKWVIKLNGEFKGRGIATIKINPSKYFKKQNTFQENSRLLLDHLKSNFKLKVKLNFENSLYMVEDFLKQLQSKGGVIEEQLEAVSTYEICFNKHSICELQFMYRVYGTNFCNKVWLSNEPTSDLHPIITEIQNSLEYNNYFGRINVTLCRTANNKIYGIDLKLHQTYSSSIIPFIRMIEEKRTYSQEEAASIRNLPTKRVETMNEQTFTQLVFQDYNYLIIPNLVFTDIEEEVKARLIEQMMGECWSDRHVKLNEQCRLFLSMGVDFSLIFIGKDVKRLKKRAIDTVRQLNDRTSSYRKYRGKQVIRDVFQYGDIIRALSQIKQ